MPKIVILITITKTAIFITAKRFEIHRLHPSNRVRLCIKVREYFRTTMAFSGFVEVKELQSMFVLRIIFKAIPQSSSSFSALKYHPRHSFARTSWECLIGKMLSNKNDYQLKTKGYRIIGFQSIRDVLPSSSACS